MKQAGTKANLTIKETQHFCYIRKLTIRYLNYI